MFRVVWKSKITGFAGFGEPMAYELAKAWADKGNRDFPDIAHCIQESFVAQLRELGAVFVPHA